MGYYNVWFWYQYFFLNIIISLFGNNQVVLHLDNAGIVLTGYNLLTITDYNWQEPELIHGDLVKEKV